MRKERVQTPSDALIYLLDCQLATVCDLALLKTRRKYEFKRQVSIAQTMFDWAKEFGLDVSSTRGEEVESFGSVEAWAKQFMPTKESA